jgi:hypothetical protein
MTLMDCMKIFVGSLALIILTGCVDHKAVDVFGKSAPQADDLRLEENDRSPVKR